MIVNTIPELPNQEILNRLSFSTTLGKSLKKVSMKNVPLSFFMTDVSAYRAVSRSVLLNSGLQNVRFKSDDSIERKFEKTLQKGLGFAQCFNDLIGIRLHFEEYPEVFPAYFRVVDMRDGKKMDDGYRAIHLYYQRDNYSYPIEIQLWCGEDYQFNLWSHMAAYKYTKPENGYVLYQQYHEGKINSLEAFEAALNKLEKGDF